MRKLPRSQIRLAITSIGFKPSRTQSTTVFVRSNRLLLLRQNTSCRSRQLLEALEVKSSGSSFPENTNLYIIHPLGHKPKKRNEAFQSEYAKLITRFTGEFIADFCTPDGAIVWEKVLESKFPQRRPLTPDRVVDLPSATSPARSSDRDACTCLAGREQRPTSSLFSFSLQEKLASSPIDRPSLLR